jgi:hypothetical protein
MTASWLQLCQYLAWWWWRYKRTVAWWFFVVALIVHGPGRSFSWCRLLQIHDGLAGEIVGVCRHGFCVTRDDSDYWDYLNFAMWTLRIVVVIWKLCSVIYTSGWPVVILISFYVSEIKNNHTFDSRRPFLFNANWQFSLREGAPWPSIYLG